MIATLKAQHREKHAAMTRLHETAEKEGRDLTDEERTQWDKLDVELEAIGGRLASATRSTQLGTASMGEPSEIPILGLDASSGKPVFCLSKQHRFVDLPDAEINGVHVSDLSFGRLVKAIATGDWTHAPHEKLAMSESVNTAGGYLVPDQMSRQIIDLARAKSVLIGLGMQVVTMTSETLRMARLITDPTFAVTSENATIASSDAAFDALTFTAHKIACRVPISRELAADAPNVPQAVEDAIAGGLAAELDRQCLAGNGSGEMLGVLNNSGITTTDASVGAISYTDLLDALEDVRDNNGEPNAYVTTAAIRTFINKLLINSESEHYAIAPPEVAALERAWTSNMSAQNLLVGDYSQLILGLRQSPTIEITTEGHESFEKHQLQIKCVWRGDCNVAHADQFALLGGITS